MKYIGSIFTVTIVLLLCWRFDALKTERDRGRNTITTQKKIITDYADQLRERERIIGTLQRLNQENEQAQAELRTNMAAVDNLLAAREKQLRELKRENESLRQWSAVQLPAVLIRLRQRPAITSAADYHFWLSSGDSLSATGSLSTDQRRSE